MKLKHIRGGRVVHLLAGTDANGAILLCGRWSSWGSFSDSVAPVTCRRCLQVAAETGDEA